MSSPLVIRVMSILLLFFGSNTNLYCFRKLANPMETYHARKEKLNKLFGGIRFSFLRLLFPFFLGSTYAQRLPGDLVPSFIVESFYG